MSRSILLRGFILIVILISFFGILDTGALAQTSLDWAIAKPIPFYDDILPPILIADQNRTVHAFNDEPLVDGRQAIFYRTWNLYTGWSQPVDVIIPEPTTGHPLQGVALDETYTFHVMYYIGNEFRGDLYYSRARASEAARASAWSSPRLVAEGAYPLPDATMIGDGGDGLYIVYTGVKDGVGVYEVHSTDGGNTWSEPTSVFRISISDTIPFHIELSLDKNGNLHAVWSIVGESGLGQAVYYARRDKETGSWNQPYRIAAAEGNDYAADCATLIEYDDSLILMYMDGTIPNGIPPTRWTRRSYDNGNNWDEPVRPFPQVGENGFAIMLIDSSNILHIILANRVGDPAIGGMWHGVWLGNQWSDLELITARSPEEAISSGSYVDVQAAHLPAAVISQGNVILTAWWHNIPEAPPAGFAYAILDSPELPLVPLPTTSPRLTPDTSVTDTRPVENLSATQLADADFNQSADFPKQKAQITGPSTLMLLGILPAVLVVILFITLRYLLRRNQ